MPTRREFMRLALSGLAAGFCGTAIAKEKPKMPFFRTRGVVVSPDDLTLGDWPERASSAGLTVIALGAAPSGLIQFIKSDSGKGFLAKCRQLGLDVEYEMHAMFELLPRSLFTENPDFFRMDDDGKRTPDANLCVHSDEALEIVCDNAVVMCKALRPTTHRYFLWFDDGQPGCRCSKCREFSDSEQALIVENRMLAAIRGFDAKARLAHLAYTRTMSPPVKVKPIPGVFLEFAPFTRSYKASLRDPSNSRDLEALDANLKVFKAEDARILEYWLDVSLFSSWKKPAVKLDLDERILRDDLRAYAKRGIRSVTTFAVFIDKDYADRYGDPPIKQYGDALASGGMIE
jgi:hypothetical protein